MARRRTSKNKTTGRKNPKTVRLYTLKVSVSRSEHEPNPAQPIFRTIQMRGDQNLSNLHQAIVAAFERTGEISYEFQFGAQPLAPRYVLPGAYDVSVEAGTPAAGRVTDTPLDSLGLKVGEQFTCASDTGDDWGHPITVERIREGIPKGKYPKVTTRVGDSPFRKGAATPHGFGQNEGADAACLVGELHLKRGEYQKAVEAFSRAIENHPTADAYQGRAQAYRGLAADDEREAEVMLR